MKLIVFLLLLGCISTVVIAQNAAIAIDESSNGKILSDVLHEIEKKYRIDFIFNEDELRAYTIHSITGSTRFREYMEKAFPSFELIRASEDVFFIVDKKEKEKYNWLREHIIVFKTPHSATFSLTGTITDGKTGDPLPGGRVFLPDLKTGDASDVNGHFNIREVPSQTLTAEVRFVGYDPEVYLIGFSQYGKDERLAVTLYPESKELETVVVTAQRMDENVVGNLTGVESLSIASIKAIPTFMGEVDPIRSITTLPGVSTAGELASGFNVRGGEAGQNLVLQDGAPIYNPSHLFGFFSSFNPDFISNVTLYKGGGPANFGGRISSVLDISLRNGNDSEHTVSGGIGLVSSRLTVEGPILKKKLSYILGGRISYANWLIQATDDIQLKNSAARFYDITGKVYYNLNDQNMLTISVYNGYDDFKFATDSVFSWKTFNMAAKWDHTFNETLSSSLSVYKTEYASQVTSISEIDGFTYNNAIENAGIRFKLDKVLNDQSKIITGFEMMGTLLEPGKLDPQPGAGNSQPENMQDQRSLENAVFLQGDVELSEKWSLSAGLRYSYFIRFGPENISVFDYGIIRGRYPVINDSVYYRKGEVIKTYQGFEPRASLRYLFSKNTSIKISYYRGYQYQHLISNTTSSTPQDYWITSGPYLKPQRGDQFSMGYFRNLKNDLYEVSAEGFYKNIRNAVDYIDGADITLNPALESGLLQGKGLAYGLEVLVKKNEGVLNGWVAYTFSRSLRQFNDSMSTRTINQGKYFASAFDQPHRLSVIVNYTINPRVVLSANFNYSTGRPITIPISKFSYDGYLSVLNYSKRNEYRIPDYHRLDLSLTIKENPRKHHRIQSEWIISVFNVYSRNNAYSVFFDKYGNASKLSVLGSIFPSITYSFKI